MSVKYDMTADALIAAGYRPIHAGDDYDHRFNIVRAGLPLPLTGVGVKVWLTVKESSIKPDADAKLQLTSASSTQIEITNAAEGRFTVKFRAGSTDDLEGVWEYDLQVKAFVDGVLKVMTVAYGAIEFLRNITRATT